jgi:uncharacterized protein YdeI (YjbR/CyaY-like superfamily)
MPSTIPADLAFALQSELQARAVFEGLPDTRRRELVRGIEKATSPQARRRLIASAVDALRLGR